MKNGPKVCSFWISGPHPRPPDRKRASDRHERNGQINQPSDGTLQGRHGQLADRRPATQPQRHKKPCPAREESNDEAETTCDHDRGGAQPDPRSGNDDQEPDQHQHECEGREAHRRQDQKTVASPDHRKDDRRNDRLVPL